MLANNAAVYGGGNMGMENNVLADTVAAGGGSHVSTRFARPVQRPGVGAAQHPAAHGKSRAQLGRPIRRHLGLRRADRTSPPRWPSRNLSIQDSTYEGLYISGSHRVLGAVFDGVTINGATTWGLQIKSGGSATLSNVQGDQRRAGRHQQHRRHGVDARGRQQRVLTAGRDGRRAASRFEARRLLASVGQARDREVEQRAQAAQPPQVAVIADPDVAAGRRRAGFRQRRPGKCRPAGAAARRARRPAAHMRACASRLLL